MDARRLPALHRDQPVPREKQKRKVQDVETVGKPRKKMCDAGIARGVFSSGELQNREEKQSAGKDRLPSKAGRFRFSVGTAVPRSFNGCV
jgi:hypothetical protein